MKIRSIKNETFYFVTLSLLTNKYVYITKTAAFSPLGPLGPLLKALKLIKNGNFQK